MINKIPKRILLKFGGAAMKDPNLAKRLFQSLAKLSASDVEITFVHGGGPEIDSMLKRLSIEPKKIDGLRVTDNATMEVVEMVLAAKVNKGLVSEAQLAGIKAVGLSALDGGIAKASIKNRDLGNVGKIDSVDSKLIKLLQSQNYLPIVCSIAENAQAQHLNINADELAASLAGALSVDLFILITDVPGLMDKYPDLTSVISKLKKEEAKQIMTSGKISSGMIPKVQSCIDALELGAKASLITDMLYPDIENYLNNYEQPKGTLIN